MMRFNCNVDGIEITIELMEKQQISNASFFQKSKKSVYDIYFTSRKNGVEMTHVSPNHILKNTRKTLETTVPEYIENKELIEHVLHHWDLESKEEPSKPDWAVD